MMRARAVIRDGALVWVQKGVDVKQECIDNPLASGCL